MANQTLLFMFFPPSHIIPKITYLPTQLFSHSRVRFLNHNPPSLTPTISPTNLTAQHTYISQYSYMLYIPHLTQYCGSKVEARGFPSRMFKICITRNNIKMYKILGINRRFFCMCISKLFWLAHHYIFVKYTISIEKYIASTKKNHKMWTFLSVRCLYLRK